jgi:hypothetical protein
MKRLFLIASLCFVLLAPACRSEDRGTGAEVRSEGSSLSREAAPSPGVPICQLLATALTQEGKPLSGLRITGRSMQRVDERRWRGADEKTIEAGPAGEFEFSAVCGSALSLDFDGWNWPREPDRLMVEEGIGPIAIHLVPERMALLRLESSPGKRTVGSFSRLASPGVPAATLQVPTSGLQIEGIPWGRLAGELNAEGEAPRPWILSRSHGLHEVAPDRFEAVIEMGPEAPLWFTTPSSVLRQIEGVWCVASAGQRKACKRVRGAWLCHCGEGRALALTSTLWDTALLRTVDNGQSLHMLELPEAVKQCFTVSADTDFQIVAEGLPADPLVAIPGIVSASGAGSCYSLPRGETLDILTERGRRSFLADGQKRVLPVPE